MTGCWKGSRTCFMLSVLVYLALPIPCDALTYGRVRIYVPPRVGDSWTYHRTTEIPTSSTTYETRIDTVTVSVVGTEQVGDQEYYRLDNGELYRTSADGVIWRYYPDRAKEEVYSDLWRVGTDQEGEIRYGGVLLGQTTDYDDAYYETGWGPVELVRRGPLEVVVGDSLYSEVFEFWMEEGRGRDCCSEFYLTLYVHPEIGAVKLTTYTMEYDYFSELISFSRQSSGVNVPSAVREVTWGTVKRRHMFERPR